MPEQKGAFVAMETLPLAARIGQDREFQAYWYEHVGQFVSGKRVLDAGAGMGYGRRIMNASGALSVTSFDLVSLVPWVVQGSIEDYAAGAFDWVVSMDVIEHVDDDLAYLKHLLRVASEAVFFSTPNWNVFHCGNEHHRREYTPKELGQLIASVPWSTAHFWTGDEHCVITDRGIRRPPDDDMCCNFGVLLRK